MFPSASTSDVQRKTLQSAVDGAESLEEVIKLFGFIELETTKQFLSSALSDLSPKSIHSAYFGVRSIVDILCDDVLINISCFLTISDRFRLCRLSSTFHRLIYLSPPSIYDLPRYETWISFDGGHRHRDGCSLSAAELCRGRCSFLQKPYLTNFKLNPLTLHSIDYLLNRVSLHFWSLKVGAQSMALIESVLTQFEGTERAQRLREWMSNLKGLAFIGHDVESINLFLLRFTPKPIYLSMNAVRSEPDQWGIGSYRWRHYLSDEVQEGYDAPQPTPTAPHQHSPSSSSLHALSLSSDYSASDDDEGGMVPFWSHHGHESSDGYHDEGHYRKLHQMIQFKAGHHRHKMARNNSHYHHSNSNNHHHHNRQNHHHHHHRTKRKVQSTRSRPMSSGLTVHRPSSGGGTVNSAKVMACESVKALFVFSETKMSSMAALLHSVQYLGLDVVAQREPEMERVQEVLFDHEQSPNLHHLTITDSADSLLIPNRVRSLVVQRGFGTLCDIQFESQFFPYSISCAHRGAERLDYFLSLSPLSRRLHALSPHGPRGAIDALSGSDCSDLDDEESLERQRLRLREYQSPKRISVPTVHSESILVNKSSMLFEVKMPLNFDIVRRRWLILKQHYRFLLRLRCIESLRVIHLVMVRQSVMDRQCHQYYRYRPAEATERRHDLVGIDENEVISNQTDPDMKRLAIYPFPSFDRRWHQNQGLHVIAPKRCIDDEKFRAAFPFATFYAFNPMIRNPCFTEEQWQTRKQLHKMSPLFAVASHHRLQSPW